MPDTPTPREYDAAELRILDAAHRVFLRRGTAGARTQEIADEAGVNKSMLHYYFRTKENLAHAVFERSTADWLRALHDAVATDAPLDEVVREVIRAETRSVEERPYLSGYVLSEMHQRPDRVRQAIRAGDPAGLERLRERLGAAHRAGSIAAVSAEEFVVNLISLIVFPHAATGMFEAYFGMGEGEWTAAMTGRTERLTAFFLRGLGYDPEPTSSPS